MLTETYKGRKIKVTKGSEWGTSSVTLNGVHLWNRQETRQEEALADVRNWIDLVDRDPVVDGSRWAAHWYAPGTYEMCPEGIHPMKIGGPCRHPSCQEQTRAGMP